jgi:hypothetical protein
MANMSYCRFENTSIDLQDCLYAIDTADSIEDLDLGEYEQRAFDRMYQQCQDFIASVDMLKERAE